MGTQSFEQKIPFEKTSARSRADSLKTSGSPAVRVNRVFHAPIDRVWQAWSQPELIKQWWGPHGYTAPTVKTDFRVGGKSLMAMQAPDGKIGWSGGIYTEIVPHKKIVTTDHFSDEDGNVISAASAGMSGDWPSDLYVTIEFEAKSDHETVMTIVHEGIPKKMNADCTKGWSESIDKLQKLVERH
jgi:uncharacterized protein YndB with AHSA1/START domain